MKRFMKRRIKTYLLLALVLLMATIIGGTVYTALELMGHENIGYATGFLAFLATLIIFDRA